MVEYKRKKIQLQTGGSRYYYYKIGSDGKKERISKEKYLESTNKKVGGDGNIEYNVLKEQSGLKRLYYPTSSKKLVVSEPGKLKYEGENVSKNKVSFNPEQRTIVLKLRNGDRTLRLRNKYDDFINKYVEKTQEQKNAIAAKNKFEKNYSNKVQLIQQILEY